MKYVLFKRCLVMGTILLLAGGGFMQGAQSLPCPVENQDTGECFQGIQEAIDDPDTLAGHTILVHTGIYYENVTVGKSVAINGDNKDDTFIVGNGPGDVILITASYVTIKGFTIQCDYQSPPYAGIKIDSTNNTINCNVIKGYYSLWIDSSSGNKIYANTISSIQDPEGFGILLWGSSGNDIIANNISGNFYGITLLESSNDNIIHHNNFDNSTNVYIDHSPCNKWYHELSSVGNYWSDHDDCDDSNGDLICDNLYPIPGELCEPDLYPLVYEWELKCGNVNGDPAGIINISDYIYLIRYVLYGQEAFAPIPPCAGDINGDGILNVIDVSLLYKYLFQGGPLYDNCCCK